MTNAWQQPVLNIVYYHIAANGWIITADAIIQLHDTWDINAEEVCPGTQARLIKIW